MMDELNSLLTGFRQQLVERDTPELRILFALDTNPRKYGLTNVPYNDAAFQECEQALQANPRDFHLIHHLAIMHHARAFDCEAAYYFHDIPKTIPDEDWRKALEYWRWLINEDGFWDELASKVSHDVKNPFPMVRRELPKRLLQIHMDIARDPAIPTHRARNHFRLILNSKFPPDIINELRAQAYRGYFSRVPDNAWDLSNYDQELLTKSAKFLIDYLKRDDDYLPALCDLLDLVLRLLKACIQVLMASGADESVRQEKIEELHHIEQTYGIYIERLEAFLGSLQDKALADLGTWHYYSGQVCMQLEDFVQATEHLEKAVAAAAQEDDPNKLKTFRETQMNCKYRFAIKLAAGSEKEIEQAQSIVALIQQEQLPPSSRLLRAQAELKLGARSDAIADARALLEDLSDPAITEEMDADEIEQLRRGCLEVLMATGGLRLGF
jgi:hypothetical protein